MADPGPVIICLTAAGATLAQRLAPVIGAEVHGRAGRAEAGVTFSETPAHLRDLFAAGIPIVGICAAGILVRATAPLLADKTDEPPVIAVAEDGSAVVPLLGGHRGANDLARRLADVLGIAPAVTTASDVVHGIALDAPPPGWIVEEELGTLKDAAAAILAGAAVQVTGDGPLANRMAGAFGIRQAPDQTGVAPPSGSDRGIGDVLLQTAETDAGDQPGSITRVRYRPQTFMVGVGCARGCDTSELSTLVEEAIADAGVPKSGVAAIFSLDLKADEAAVLDLGLQFGRPVRFFTAAELETQTPRLANPSDIVFAEVGCHGVAEAAALAAAGPDAALTVEKQKSANATVAIAQAPQPITQLAGRRRGQVSLIGIGPGQAIWRTPEASRLIANADELVGYGLYIDLIGPLARGKPCADFPLGGEEDRCRYALEEAGKGREIALICSGDAGIYAMGALVYELMARDGALSDAARRVEVVTAPGVSALQAAAARSGAPLGHDFCAISLSDLLTPRADIEARVHAAARGDFVIAFYNPVSKRRRDLFPWAVDVLKDHRPADTPVILAASLGRPDEVVRIITLAQVTTDAVDMLTTVIVGSSQSGLVRVGGHDRVFTPRGYAAKLAGAAE